jgi:citrate lyase subunit beta/citryl-CoA lyase
MPAQRFAAPDTQMTLRSLLFVPGDRPERFAKAAASGADALILDLEDAVSADRKAVARESIRSALLEPSQGPALFVRINPLDSIFVADDLGALAGTRPYAIMLPKAEGRASVEALDTLLRARDLGDVPLLPIATETPAAIFELGSYRAVSDRLIGLTWGAEDLPAAIGASTSREADGHYRPPYEMARSLTLFAAAAASVAPIDTVYPAFRDLDGLKLYAERAATDGFTGMMAIHPTQVAIINNAFRPPDEAIAHANRVIAAFEAADGAGAVQLDGAMIDAPHLKQAYAVVGRALDSHS